MQQIREFAALEDDNMTLIRILIGLAWLAITIAAILGFVPVIYS